MNVIDIGGIRYVKASDASKKVGYTADYVGQLIRAGKVPGQQIGRTWYVREDAILGHKSSARRGNKQKTREAFVEARESLMREQPHAIYNALPSEEDLPEYRKHLMQTRVSYMHDDTPLVLQPKAHEPSSLASVPSQDRWDEGAVLPVTVEPESAVVEVEKLGKTLSITKVDPSHDIFDPSPHIEPAMQGTITIEDTETSATSHQEPALESVHAADRQDMEEVPQSDVHIRPLSRFEERLEESSREAVLHTVHHTEHPQTVPFIPHPKPTRRLPLSLTKRSALSLMVPVLAFVGLSFALSTLLFEQIYVYEKGGLYSSYGLTNSATILDAFSRQDEILFK